MNVQFKDMSSLFSALGTDEELRSSFVAKVATSFREELSYVLEEQELIAIDYANAVTGSKGTCASHMFLDSNHQMNDAINEVAADHITDDGGVDDFLDLMQSDLAAQASSVWGDAWALSIERGFSSLWSRSEELNKPDLHALAFVVMDRPDRSDPRYGLEDIRMSEELFPPLPAFITDKDALAEATSSFVPAIKHLKADALSRIASEARASLDALDEPRLLDLVGAVNSPRP